jgi:hypothetical protein
MVFLLCGKVQIITEAARPIWHIPAGTAALPALADNLNLASHCFRIGVYAAFGFAKLMPWLMPGERAEQNSGGNKFTPNADRIRNPMRRPRTKR